MFRLLACLGILLSSSFVEAELSPAHTSHLNWTTNLDSALQQAAQEKKPLLLFFTGSEWCGWCKKLDQEVFTTAEFANAVGNQFIFVVFDVPTREPRKYSDLQNKYNVTGFPTVVVIDAQGRVLGSTGYLPGGPKAYADHLMQMVQNHR